MNALASIAVLCVVQLQQPQASKPDDVAAQIVDAALRADSAALQTFVQRGISLDTVAETGDPTALASVCGSKPDAAIVRFFLENEADASAADRYGITALHRACRGGALDVIRLLLQYRADVNAKDKAGLTPLHAAAACRNREVVDFLIASGASVNARSATGTSPLAIALEYGDSDSIIALLSKGADASGTSNNTKDGRPLLLLAAAFADPETIAPLIESGARADSVDEERNTAIHVAVAKQRGSRMIGSLIEVGVPVDQANRANRTPLLCLCAEGEDDESAARMLLQHGASPNVHDSQHRTALMHAASGLRAGCVRALLNLGADVNAREDEGLDSMILAAKAVSVPALWRELSAREESLGAAGDNDEARQVARARVAQTKEKMESVVTAQAAIIGELIRAGYRSEDAKERGGLALRYVAAQGSAKAVMKLLELKCDITARDERGRTALDVALERTDPERDNVVRALRASGVGGQ